MKNQVKNSVFELIENNYDEVILKVNADNTLIIAKNPYISGDMDYITVTKGGNHILTVIRKDGTTFSFHWGYGGYTLIGESTKMLKDKVISFIQNECHIPLELKGNIVNATIYFNSNFGKWQLNMNGSANIWSDTARTLEEMKEWCKDYIKAKGWKHGIAQTGIDVWDAIM